MSINSTCSRCAEPYAEPAKDRACRFCIGELRQRAVTALTENQGESNQDKFIRANAVDMLRILGHSQEEVVHARARAFDGHSVEDILKGLCGDERVGVLP